jgi:probable rRNA maturation factor
LDSPDAELSVVIVDDDEIATLNRTYLNRQGPTNVIAFSMREGAYADISPQLLGDVVISIETAHRESEEADIDPWSRFDQLLVHGILHLFGYKHETDETEAARMEEKSEELLKLILNGK